MALKLKTRIPLSNGKAKEEEDDVPGEQHTLGGTDAIADKKVYPDPRTEFQELRDALQIDKNSLDTDMIQQPVLFMSVCEAHVMAMSERDTAKEKLASVDAQLAHDTRTKWTNSGEKFSEVRVGDQVQTEPKHIVQYAYFQHLVRRAAYLGALKDSYEQRGKMLHELGSLFVSGYFSTVSAKSAAKDVDEVLAAKGREGMRRARQGA